MKKKKQPTIKVKKKVGRPEAITKEKVELLRQAFMIGASDREACAYAEINPATLYDYQKRHPEFVEQKEAWKEGPILRARQTVVDDLKHPETAKWFLERKMRHEFAKKTELGGELELKTALVKFVGDDDESND